MNTKYITLLLMTLCAAIVCPANAANICQNFSRNLISQNDTYISGISAALTATTGNAGMTIVGVCNGNKNSRGTGTGDPNPTIPSTTTDYSNCWCRITGPVVSAYWAYAKKYTDTEHVSGANYACFLNCASYCIKVTANNTGGMADTLLNYLL